MRSTPRTIDVVGLIAAAFVLATGFRWIISLIRSDVPFATYFPVVMLATSLRGVKAGLCAIAIGALLGSSITMGATPTGMALAGLSIIYVIASLVIVWFADHYRSLALHYKTMAEKLKAEEDYRGLVVGELAHRLKNKLSTVQAIVRQSLKQDPTAWRTIERRLSALSATDDLIIKSDAAGCDLLELVKLELAPYGSSRTSFSGTQIYLEPKLAVSLGLLIHELATNAAKYGCLSAESGLLQVSWSNPGKRLSLVWDESNGPSIVPPATEGFGTKLMRSALGGYDGRVTTDYLPSGLHCVINCRLSAVDVE